jgi:hypothetical protein
MNKRKVANLVWLVVGLMLFTCGTGNYLSAQDTESDQHPLMQMLALMPNKNVYQYGLLS